MSLLVVTTSALAQETAQFSYGDFKYEMTSPNTVSVVGLSKDCSSTVLAVPRNFKYEGVGYTVTSIGESAFRWTDVTSITLPNTIDSLKYAAFYGADKLAYIGLPESLKYMGDYCFGSTKITSIIIPEGIKEIPASCFFNVPTLRQITFPSTLKKICNSSFYKCTGLSEIIIPEGVEEVGKAFLYCTGLQNVKLPSTLKIIGMGAFNNCTALRSIDIPSSVEEIGEEAFFQDDMLREITLPRSLKKLGGGAFAKSAIETIKLEKGNENFILIDGCLYSKDARVLYQAPMIGLSDVSVAQGCVGIASGAFWGSEITNVTLPETMLAIDSYAFCQSNLNHINFPFTLRLIGEQALASTNLSSVVFPENMPTVSNAVLAGCKSLVDVTLPSNVDIVENRAFWGCTSLKKIHCLGSLPPDLDDWYDTDECPFASVSATLSVPKGYLQVYKESTWAQASSNIVSIVEGEAPVLIPDTIIVEGTYNEGYENITAIRMRFGSAVHVSTVKPRINILIDNDFTGTTEKTAESWNLKASGNDAVFTPLDVFGKPVTINLNRGLTYYVIVPSQIVSSVDSVSEHMVIAVITPDSDPIDPIAVTPADNSEVEQLSKISLTFAEEVYVKDYDVKAVLKKQDGTEVTVDMWYAQKNDLLANTIDAFPCTVSGWNAYIAPITLESGIAYTLVLPKGFACSKSQNAKNNPLTLTISGYDKVPNINPIAVTPASDEIVTSLSNVTMTFAENVTVINQLPKVLVTKGTLDGDPVDVEAWYASVRPKNPKLLTLTPAELDGTMYYPQTLSLDANTTYYVQIPKAVVEGETTTGKNAAYVLMVNAPGDGIHNVTTERSRSKFAKILNNGRIVLRSKNKTFSIGGAEY